MSVQTIIAAYAPAFASDSRLPTFITLATNQTATDRFGVNYELAIALRACHMMARNPTVGMGAAGAVTSETEGEISRSYSIPKYLQEKYGDLCSTPYGAQLAQLIEGNIFPDMVATGDSDVLFQGEQV